MFTHVNVLTREIIGAAIEVHRHLGPGLLESAYQQCLARELAVREIPYECERPLPLEYKGVRLNCGYRVDFLVDNAVVVEPSLSKQLHRYMKPNYSRIWGL